MPLLDLTLENHNSDEHLQDVLQEAVSAVIRGCSPRSVILLGSASRREMHSGSDVDLLVILRQKTAMADLRGNLSKYKFPVSLLSMTDCEFLEHWKTGTLVASFVNLEGQVCFDDGYFLRDLPRPFVMKKDFSSELTHVLKKAECYRDLDLFERNYLYVLSTLFWIFKNIAMYSLASKGILEPRKRVAIEKFFKIFREHAQYKERVLELEAFYIYFHRDINVALPFSYYEANGVRKAFEALDYIKESLK